MGQIKNIKLHIVTDIKEFTVLMDRILQSIHIAAQKVCIAPKI